MLVDSFGRQHTYLRISVTDACNLRCTYCLPNTDLSASVPSSWMQVDEMVKIATFFVEQGVTKIRLTGGEPLLRKDIGKIIQALGLLPVELTMTTNGVLLDRFWPVLEVSGVSPITISIDSLQPDVNKKITQRDFHQRVLDNIQEALRRNIPIKLNVVIMKGVNEFEIPDFIALTRQWPLQVRFIEFMPFTGNAWRTNDVVTMQQMLEIAQSRFPIQKLPGQPQDTAQVFQVPGFAGSFGIIPTMSVPFCEGCNRIRLTADGKLRNCLFAASETDLLTPLRQGQDLQSLVQANIESKHARQGGQFAATYELTQAENIQNRPMIQLGG